MADWPHKLVKTEEYAVEDLLTMLHPDNARIHPQTQVDATEDIIDAIGLVDEIKVNARTGRVFNGHLRIKLALQKGQETLPVNVYDLSEGEEALALRAFDAVTTEAIFDQDKLDLLREKSRGLEVDREALVGLMTRARAAAGVAGGNEDEGKDTEVGVDRAQELQEVWKVKIGDTWRLDEHYLLCGDCTDPKVAQAVAFGEPFDLVFADPPYGVSYADKNKYLNAVAFGNRIQTPIENDHLTVDEVTELWRKSFKLLFEGTKPGGAYYITGPQGGELMMMMMMIHEAGWLLKPQIIWAKNNHVLGRSDYQLKHEPILYGWKPGAAHYFTNSRSEMSVWNIDKPLNSDLHPTEKPLELVERAIRNSSRPGEIVADFFAGSGTTIIASENLGRRARAIEISPAYCSVILERYLQHTSDRPQLLTTGNGG